MTTIAIITCITACVLTLICSLVVITLASEGERRATAVAVALSLPMICAYHLLWLWSFPGRDWIALAAVVLPGVLLFILLLPMGKVRTLRIPGPQNRMDERDAVFHRFYRLEPGTPDFDAYYEQHPDKVAFDEKVRALPPLAGPGSKTYHPLSSPFQIASFSLIEEISRDLEWSPSPVEGKPVEASPAEFAKRIKGYAHYLGAKMVGCTKLNPAYVYSHIGRSPGVWGTPVELDHSHAIAIVVEMSHEMVRHSPDDPTTTETAFQYLEAGKIAMLLARYINLLGYEARAHVDGNYRVQCVPIAVDAGLGELGRLGLLITPVYGPRIRLSVVTTKMPLAQDEPVTFGVQDFCSFCKKCADICPSGSIDKGDPREHNGAVKWRSEQDTCYRYWRMAGSDCAVCVKVCPYSHPDNFMHNAVRLLIERNALARRLALHGDDLLFGRRPDEKYPLPPWHAK